jgi:hypothetical protein
MMFWLSFFMFFSQADTTTNAKIHVNPWMSVRNLQEMKTAMVVEEKENTFFLRCRAELRGNYLPLHCYRWLEVGTMRASTKIYLLKTLDDTCVRRLGDGIPVGEKILAQYAHLSTKCQKAVKSWISVKIYKMNREKTEKLFDKLGTGSIFETVLDHANSESVSPN